MDALPLIYVAVGGALGSLARYFVATWIGRLSAGSFPLPIFIVNISGSFLMGLWIGAMTLMLPGKAKELHLLIAVGVLGGYTTFSTFSLESYMLLEKGLWLQAATYMAGSVLFSVAALFAGLWLMRMVSA